MDSGDRHILSTGLVLVVSRQRGRHMTHRRPLLPPVLVQTFPDYLLSCLRQLIPLALNPRGGEPMTNHRLRQDPKRALEMSQGASCVGADSASVVLRALGPPVDLRRGGESHGGTERRASQRDAAPGRGSDGGASALWSPQVGRRHPGRTGGEGGASGRHGPGSGTHCVACVCQHRGEPHRAPARSRRPSGSRQPRRG